MLTTYKTATFTYKAKFTQINPIHPPYLQKNDHLLLKIILNYTIFNLFYNFSQTFKLTLPHKNFLNEKINQKNKRNSHANGASSIK